MEPRAHHVLIGLFTVLMVTTALGFALWLGKSSSDKEFNDYEVIFNEAVSGLSQGSAVQYSGIKVGDVISLTLDVNDPRKVHAHIRVSANTPIKEDTRARLSITGITGAALIQLHSGTPDSPLLRSKDGQRAQIIADRSPLSRLMANGEDLVISVTRLLSHANQLVNTEGRAAFANANRMLASLERSSATVESLLSDNRDALHGGMQGVSELGPTIIELRETLSALRSFSRRLEEDPAGYLLRSDSIKEFQP